MNAKHTVGSVKYYQFNNNALLRGCRFECNPEIVMDNGGQVSLSKDNTGLIISESVFEY